MRRVAVAKVLDAPEGMKACPCCHAMPVITHDATGESRAPFELTCGDNATIWGDTLDEILGYWDDEESPHRTDTLQ